MSVEVENKNLGHATAYAYAKAKGYQGTEEEFAQALTDVSNVLEDLEGLRAEAETLPEGSEASVSYANGMLSFGIPKGDTGAKGNKGDKGDKGNTGTTPNFSIGTVTTLEPNQSATAEITGTAEQPVLSLGIPKGAKGDPGDVANLADVYDSTKIYAVGDYCIKDGQYKVCIVPITTAEAWNSAHWADAEVGEEISDLKVVLNDTTEKTINIFDMHVFDGVEGITKDANGYYTGTGTAFNTAFNTSVGVPNLTFEVNKQYFLSALVYTDGNVSTSAVNGLQFSFYTSNNTRIGRKSILNNVTTSTKATVLSTEGNSVDYMTIGVSNSAGNIWHIKDIMLCASPVEVDYIPHETAVDQIARNNVNNAVISANISNEAVVGSYINLSGKSVGSTVSLDPTVMSAYQYALIDCNVGDTFIVTASGASAAKPWAFVKNENNSYVITDIFVLAPNSSDYSVANTPIIAKESGKLIVNGTKSNPFAILKIVNSQLVEQINKAQFLDADIKSKRWYGKKIVTFGDSRTWYDKHSYTENTKSDLVEKTCIGYQEQMRCLMMATVENQGASGETSAEICTRIRNFDFTGYDAVFFEGGVNDFIKSSQVTIGEIQPIGSTFDTTTVYGAWQSAVEYLLTSYPSVLVYMDIPAIAWKDVNDIVFPYDTAKIKGEIAALYNIPCLDLYKNAGINVINRDHWYCDDVSATNWRLHFNDYGNALIGAKIAEFMISE